MYVSGPSRRSRSRMTATVPARRRNHRRGEPRSPPSPVACSASRSPGPEPSGGPSRSPSIRTRIRSPGWEGGVGAFVFPGRPSVGSPGACRIGNRDRACVPSTDPGTRLELARRAAPRGRHWNGGPPGVMRFLARMLVRWRWFVVACWTLCGLLAAFLAPRAEQRLSTRGGSSRPTEASRVEDSPADPVRSSAERIPCHHGPVTRARSTARIRRTGWPGCEGLLRTQPYIRRGPVLRTPVRIRCFLGPDGHTTFIVASLRSPSSDSAGGLVAPVRALVRAVFPPGSSTEGYQSR